MFFWFRLGSEDYTRFGELIDVVRSLKYTFCYLIVIFFAHISAMMYFEDMALADAVWLTLTTITTVGYGDISASTLPGRIATVVFLYIGGIFILAKMAGDYFDYRGFVREKKLKGEWWWNMNEHIVILSTPMSQGEQYFTRLISQFRCSKEYHNHTIQIVTNAFTDGLPESLHKLGKVTHYSGAPNDPESLQAVNIVDAKLILVLAKYEDDKSSDGMTFDIIHRLKDMNVNGSILAECVDDNNRKRLLNAGAKLVIRPICAYPGMVVRTFSSPGSEEVMESLFRNTNNNIDKGANDIYKKIDIKLNNKPWSEVVCACINHDIGTAVAFVAEDDRLFCNPSGHQSVNTSAIFIMVKENKELRFDDVREALLSH